MSPRRRIDLLFPTLPPALNGIGDYTARLAEALAADAEVGVLAAPGPADPIPGVELVPIPDLLRGGLAEAVRRRRPDWLVAQYNPFSYGRRGFAPRLPLALRACRRASPGTRLAVMFHEMHVPFAGPKQAVLWGWQRPQFAAAAALAEVAFFSIEAWTEGYRRRHPGRRAVHLPVGSNVPRADADRAAVRAESGVAEDEPALGLFGTAHVSRLLPLVDAALAAAGKERPGAALLYVGPHGAAVRAAVRGRVIDAGRLPAAEVSRRFAALDVALAPFRDGVSTRRTSLMTGLQHGVATVGTDGFLTDRVLSEADGRALALTPPAPAPFAAAVAGLLGDDARRAGIGAAGRALYESAFDWPVIARRLTAELAAAGGGG